MTRSSCALVIGSLCGGLCLGLAAAAHAVEFHFADSTGMPAYGYAATAKPKPDTKYLLVIGVHGVGGEGQGAGGAAQLARDFPDVIVLGPTFASPEALARKAERQPTIEDYYQTAGPVHEAKINELIDQVAKVWPIYPQVVLHGFSGGAQFAHRYGMKNPDRVAGVAAHSAGTWSRLDGTDKINPEAKDVLFYISCGEGDVEFSSKSAPFNRINAARKFNEELKSLKFEPVFKTWPRTGHQFTPGAYALTKELVQVVREKNGVVDSKSKTPSKGKK